MIRAVALVDGEHYAPVVRDALRALPYEWVGAILVGGTEKLRDGFDIGVPLVDGFGDAEVVVDLSDEPVLGPAERFRWISRALAAGIAYVGADFRFDPPAFAPFELPSIAVIGTGKRVGKTAVTAHLARLLAREHDVLVVAMGRGGPPEPELVEEPPSVADLVARSRDGRHAASDHLEVAALTGVTTIGCRRAGGGWPEPSSSRTSKPALASQPRVVPTSSSSTGAARRSRPSTSTVACSSSVAAVRATPT